MPIGILGSWPYDGLVRFIFTRINSLLMLNFQRSIKRWRSFCGCSNKEGMPPTYSG